ncbi:DEAD/DEAH box helicase [Terricaulis silvestris]|uniref:DEAD-box ATP-dependent RNA helicase RhpA n=1 Tax=Terricaulis silvestris TaxID=2686094 RepID=A0A6I6MLY3_9CAUL|nr:DEAD/DEAH box helicase [Terricaulis silvestris]QGZ94236.1 ATP-dependent RNA helicase RhlE [Terricaulis silvestris]
MITFQDLGVSAPILKALEAEGYTTPTPIQIQALPIVQKGRDLIGLAQTGTGKTAAFALPILDRLHQNRKHAGEKSCRTLVLAPTRELAAQIGDSFRAYGKFLGLSTTVVFGGASMHKQKQAMFRGVDILVATPGRLLDHVSQRSIRLDKVEILVLDEADHMMDMGFIHDLRKIATILPRARQTLFFSATMPPAIEELAAQFLDRPEKISVAPQSTTAERVQQVVVHVDQSKKQDLLHAMLADKGMKRALVFARTKHGADRVANKLESAGFNTGAIHGNKSQGQRTRALDDFKRGKTRILVATEVAARGIDVDDITHVINFDLPNVPEQYVHRIGRTARAGTDGIAISFCAPDERAYLKDIERLTKQPVPVMETDMSLRAPRADDRPVRPKGPAGRNGQQQQRKHAPKKHHASETHGKAHAKQGHAPSSAREEGDRRDRKGNDVWSNAGPPRRLKRRPARV